MDDIHSFGKSLSQNGNHAFTVAQVCNEENISGKYIEDDKKPDHNIVGWPINIIKQKSPIQTHDYT